MEEPPEIEHWKRISILGSGAFGVVSLWQHKLTDEYIAIKKCKFKTNNNLTDKQRKRWENEVQIMQSLNCPNIVSVKTLPNHLEGVLLKYNPTKLPLLPMEYCTKGNLRHVLSQVKNSSGLQEQDVRVVLSDITNAVSYLHQQNITHRDIKPENIVLQHCYNRPENVIYKLIDLGYAKELNDSVVSFVGTLHYLAPEIMQTENYNYNVDYWSLGTVVFEVICGVLPFLPQYSPVERFPYIQKKKAEDICIYQLHSGSVAYSTELLKENHISTCLKQNIEPWLRSVLQFEPSLRGIDCPGGSIFNNLLNILEKKIVTVFSVHTLEFYSYEINEGTLISTLKDWIARDTKVQRTDQVLFSNLRMFDITDDKYVVSILPLNDSSLFVFKKGAFIVRENFTLPKYVRILFEKCTSAFALRELRQLYTKSLFFLSQEEKLSKYLMSAFTLCTHYIQHFNKKLKENMQRLHKTLNNVLIRLDCYHNLHDINKLNLNNECYKEYKKYLVQLQELLVNLEKCVHTANGLMNEVQVWSQRQIDLNQLLPNVTPVLQNCDFSLPIAKASDLIMRVGSNGQDLTPREMVKIVSAALKEKDKLLNNKNFQNYSKAMLVAIRDMEILHIQIDKLHAQVEDLSKAIDKNQREQYQTLLIACQQKDNSSLTKFCSDHFVHWDTDTVIRENQDLRCQVEEVIGQMVVAHKIFCDDTDLPYK